LLKNLGGGGGKRGLLGSVEAQGEKTKRDPSREMLLKGAVDLRGSEGGGKKKLGGARNKGRQCTKKEGLERNSETQEKREK